MLNIFFSLLAVPIKRRSLPPVCFFLIILMVLPESGTSAWHLRSELGFYRSSQGAQNTPAQLMTRLEGGYRFSATRGQHRWEFKTRIKPEVFDLAGGTSSVKWFFLGSYRYNPGRFTWNFSVSPRRFTYYNMPHKIRLTILQTNGSLAWQAKPGLSLSLNAAYFGRGFSNGYHNWLNAGIFTTGGRLLIGKRFYFYGGVYTLRFLVSQSGESSAGGQVGPEIGLDFRNGLILTVHFRYLIHRSDITWKNSNARYFRAVFGKMVAPDWTLLLLADFTVNRFNLKQNADLNLLFYPVNNENRFYLKVENDLEKGLSVYLKCGYLKDDLLSNSQPLSGWELVTGLRLSR